MWPEPRFDDRPLRLGIIGAGAQGKRLMVAALRIPGNRFTAVCDIVPARRKEAAEIAGGKVEQFEDYAQLLANADIDGVLIAAPLHLHRPMAIEAFRHGRDVFCETAMALTIEDCRAMMSAAASARRVLQIGHHLRYHAIYHVALWKFIKPELLGTINNIHCQWNRNGSWRKPVAADTQAADFKKWGYDQAEHLQNWHLYRPYSGGLMTELAIHQLDVVRWFLNDAMPKAVTGVGRIDRQDGRTVFDNVHLIYEFPDDIQVTYEAITTNAYNPYGVEAYEMFQGHRGTLIMAHLSRYVGLYFLEPGAIEPLWVPLASSLKFGHGNITVEKYGRAILVRPSPDPVIAGIRELLREREPLGMELTVSTAVLEMHDFKHAVLDRRAPQYNPAVAFRSTVAALAGLEAMEKQQRVEIGEKF